MNLTWLKQPQHLTHFCSYYLFGSCRLISSVLIVFALIDLFVVSCSHWTALYAWSADAEPIWRPKDEQIRQPGADVQVCIRIPPWIQSIHWPIHETFTVSWSGRGRQYLRWTTPPTSTRFSTSDCSGSGLFCTTLRISNATVNETGQYQCSYRDLKVEDGKTSVAAYVFVHGTTPFNLTWLWEGFANMLQQLEFGQFGKSWSSIYLSRLSGQIHSLMSWTAIK